MRTLVIVSKKFVRGVDAVNGFVGRISMWLFLALVGILLWDVFTTSILKSPSFWVMEMAQFTMTAYYILGAGYTMRDGAHVRMDFLYERWRPRRRALADSLSAFFLIFFLVLLLIGGWNSTSYAIETGQRNYTTWAPHMAPIKIIMTFGVFLLLLQSFSELVKDIYHACGYNIVKMPVPQKVVLQRAVEPEPEYVPYRLTAFGLIKNTREDSK